MPAPSTKIDLDEKQYTIKVSLGTLKKFEELTGLNALSKDTFNDMSASTLSSLVYAMLHRSHQDVSQDDIDDMLHPGNMKYVSEEIGKLIDQFNSKKK